MVKYNDPGNTGPQLDAIFAALGDQTRRSILLQLTEGPASVSEIAAPYDMSLPAVSKHLKVLERAGLLIREQQGRIHRCRIDVKALSAASGWIEHMRQFWEDNLDNLEAYLVENKGADDEPSS